MSAAAPAASAVPASTGFFSSTIGRKVVMAVTGVILCGFILGHMIGNLQAFIPDGGKAIDAYGAFLKHMLHGAGIWVVRAVILGSAFLHVWAFVTLWLTNRAARPQGYKVTAYKEATFSSRTMKVTGPLLLAFIVYHIMHMTVGGAHPSFQEGRVYHNLVAGLTVVPVAVFYLVAMAALAFHVWHGVWSMLQTLGANHPTYNPWRQRLAVVFTILVAGGFAIVPIAILLGWIRE